MPIAKWVGPPKSFTSGRRVPIQVVVVHETRGSEGYSSAEDGAAYDKRRTDGTSTHVFADADTVCREVWDGDRAHAARAQGNEIGLQLEICGANNTAGQWADDASQRSLKLAAIQTAEWCKAHGIPARRLSVPELRQARYGAPGARPKGIVGHVDVTKAFPEDGGDHTDPGSTFPWGQFLSMVNAALGGTGEVEIMAKLVIVNDGPAGKGAVYGSGGGVRRGFASWEKAVAWASFWKCPTTGLETIAWAQVADLLGPDIGDLATGGGGSSGDVLMPHTHAVSLSGQSGPARLGA